MISIISLRCKNCGESIADNNNNNKTEESNNDHSQTNDACFQMKENSSEGVPSADGCIQSPEDTEFADPKLVDNEGRQNSSTYLQAYTLNIYKPAHICIILQRRTREIQIQLFRIQQTILQGAKQFHGDQPVRDFWIQMFR